MHADDDTSRIIHTPRSARRRGSTPDERQGGPAQLATARRRPAGHAPHPAQIGRFPVLKPLGQGGMGIVYACYDDQLDRKIAVKVLHEERVRDHDHATARLRREAQAMAKLSHPNIVTVHEVGETDGLVYVAMEFVAGVSLDVWATEPRPWRDVLAALLQAGRGLAAAHHAGLVHRDFKPKQSRLPPKASLPRNAVDLHKSGLLRGRRFAQEWSGMVRMAQSWPKLILGKGMLLAGD